MEAVDVARWQFAITTVYHFVFVPLTIGLAPLVAIMQTAWLVTGTSIRGVAPVGAPSRPIGQEELQASGVVSTADIVRAMWARAQVVTRTPRLPGVAAQLPRTPTTVLMSPGRAPGTRLADRPQPVCHNGVTKDVPSVRRAGSSRARARSRRAARTWVQGPWSRP